MRLSATMVESFRLALTSDWMTEQKLLDDIMGVGAKSKYAELGTAFHDIIQHPFLRFDDYAKASPEHAGSGFLAKNGIVFPFQTITDIYADINYNFPFEIPFEKVYKINGDDVTISMRSDQIVGLVCIDFKAKFTPFDFKAYMDSMQWRLYCDITGCEAFQYLIYEFNSSNICTKKHKPSLLYPYPGMDADIERILKDFHDYINLRGLNKYFLDKKPRLPYE